MVYFESKITKILIIDDELQVAKLFAQRLVRGNEDFSVHVLTDPKHVLKHIEEFKPDLIFLDFKMPNFTGLDCMKLIRGQFSALELPVIMLTSEEATDVIVQCLEAGASDYILKGAPFSIVNSRIKLHLGLLRLTRENIKTKELQAIMAVVVSYNHEINNPLAIAMGVLHSLKDLIPVSKYRRLKEALDRIADVVKSMQDMGEKLDAVEFTEYTDHEKTKMLKLK